MGFQVTLGQVSNELDKKQVWKKSRKLKKAKEILINTHERRKILHRQWEEERNKEDKVKEKSKQVRKETQGRYEGKKTIGRNSERDRAEGME